MRLINKIILHCSATEDTPSKSYDAIKRYHTVDLGWKDIGYHYILEYVKGEVQVYNGRPIETVGAHCKGQNTNSIGICIVGNFDKTEPTKAMYHKLAGLLMELLIEYDLDITDIFPHYRFSKEKTCPGRKFNLIELVNYILED